MKQNRGPLNDGIPKLNDTMTKYTTKIHISAKWHKIDRNDTKLTVNDVKRQ